MNIGINYSNYKYVYLLDQNGKYLGQTSTHAVAQQSSSMSFREVMEAMKNVPSWTNIPESAEIMQFTLVPDFSVKDFTSTGYVDGDRMIKYGLEYKASCFDLTHCGEFDELTMNCDYTGMTVVEKYKAIYERYQYCFGENFLDARAIRYNDTPVRADDPYRAVINMFNDEVEAVCGKENPADIRCEALYGDMRDEDIMQAIMEKYNPNGRSMTLRQMCKATYEMELCGVNEELCGVLNQTLSYIDSKNDWLAANGMKPRYDTIYEKEMLLDSPVMSAYLNDVKNSAKNMPVTSGITNKTFAGLDFLIDYITNQIEDAAKLMDDILFSL